MTSARFRRKFASAFMKKEKKISSSRSGRFSSGPGADVASFSESISFDWRLWRHDLGSMAHATMLQRLACFHER